MKSKRAKSTDISKKVKDAVYKRDKGLCIFCGKRGLPNAHVISRANGGLGIEENIITACIECHRKLDQSTNREDMLIIARSYLKAHYGEVKEVRYENSRKVKKP